MPAELWIEMRVLLAMRDEDRVEGGGHGAQHADQGDREQDRAAGERAAQLVAAEVARDERQELGSLRALPPGSLPVEHALVEVDDRGRRTSRARGSWVTITTVLPNSCFSVRSRREHLLGVLARRGRRSARRRPRSRDRRRSRARSRRAAARRPRAGPAGGRRARRRPTMRSAVSARRAALRLRQVREQERELHVLARREHRDQVEELEHEAQVLGPEAGELVLGELREPAPGHAHLALRSADRGRRAGSSSVDLPEPEGPISATKRPFSMARLTSSSA